MRTILFLLSMALMASFMACKPKEAATAPLPRPAAAQPLQPRITGGTAAAMPRAVIYRTNGNFNRNVPVNIGDDGMPVGFPAPGDVGAFSEPLTLADGWLLDRRGINAGSRFLRYTYTEYAALPAAPSDRQLLDSIIPDAYVTQLYVLPVSLSEALADTAALNEIIRQGHEQMKF